MGGEVEQPLAVDARVIADPADDVARIGARRLDKQGDVGQLSFGGAFGQLDLGDELVGNVFKMAGSRVFWLGKEVHRAKRESLHRGVAALFRMRAEQNDGQRRAAHDEPQHFHAVHARHFQVESDNVGLQFLNLL